MIKKKKSLYAYLALLLAMFFWGISFVWTKELLNADFDVIFIVTFRLIISFLLLFCVFKATKKLEKIKRKDLPKFFLLSFFEPFLYFIGENFGLQYVDASFAAIVISTIPIFIPFGLYIFCKEKLHWNILFGVVLSIVGICLMSFSVGFMPQINTKGLLLLLLAVVSASGYSVMLSKLLNYSPVTITLYQNLISICYYLPLLFVFEFPHIGSMNWNPHTILCFVMLSVFCSSIAFIGYSYAAKKISIAKASVFTNTIPIITIIFAVLIGQEALSVNKVIGMIIVIGGVFLSQFSIKKNKNKLG
jgi:drug/metabolite transporter (DMT)-like permease